MKRDMDLIREVLLRVEGLELPSGAKMPCSGTDPAFQIDGYSEDEVDHHLRLLADAGFLLNAKPARDGVILQGLSWQGCEFLDAVRSPEVWRRTKEGAAKAGAFTVKLLAEMATAYAKQVAQERLGLHLG